MPSQLRCCPAIWRPGSWNFESFKVVENRQGADVVTEDVVAMQTLGSGLDQTVHRFVPAEWTWVLGHLHLYRTSVWWNEGFIWSSVSEFVRVNLVLTVTRFQNGPWVVVKAVVVDKVLKTVSCVCQIVSGLLKVIPVFFLRIANYDGATEGLKQLMLSSCRWWVVGSVVLSCWLAYCVLDLFLIKQAIGAPSANSSWGALDLVSFCVDNDWTLIIGYRVAENNSLSNGLIWLWFDNQQLFVFIMLCLVDRPTLPLALLLNHSERAEFLDSRQ